MIENANPPPVEHTAPSGIPLGMLPALLTVIVLCGGAVIGLVLGSLRPGAISGGPIGLADWGELLRDGRFRDALAFTVLIAVVSTLVSAALAVIGAGLLQRRPRWIRGAFASTLAMPHLVVASLAVAWLAPGGIAERLFDTVPLRVVGDEHGLGIVLVYVFKETPFLLLLVLASWDHQTRDLEEAAAVLGATPWARLRDVVLPRITPPLAAGAMVVAAFTLGATEIPLLVGPTDPDTLATYALTTIATDGPIARARASAALVVATALALSVATVGLVVRHRRAARRR